MHCVRWVVIARQSIPLLRTWWQSTAGGVNILISARHESDAPLDGE